MSARAYYMKYTELMQVIGAHAADKLTASMGGSRFYVREKLDPDSELVLTIGLEAATILASHVTAGIGGLAIDIPRGRGSVHDEYRQRLRELAAAPGWSEADIALQMGVHARTVRRMRATLRREREAALKAVALQSRAGHDTGQLSGASPH